MNGYHVIFVILISCQMDLIWIGVWSKPVIVIEAPMTNKDAMEHCESKHGRIADVANRDVREVLAKYGTIRLWLPMEKLILDQWYTFTGTKYGTEVEIPAGRDKSLEHAFIRAADGGLGETKPNSPDLDYACSFNASTGICPLDGRCLTFSGNLSIMFKKGGGSWFDGLKACQDRNLNLAEFPKSLLPEILNKVRIIIRDGSYAVGIVHSSWYWLYNKTMVQNYHWMPGEPTPGHNCSVVYHNNGKPEWKAVSCWDKFPFLCEDTFNCEDDRNLSVESTNSDCKVQVKNTESSNELSYIISIAILSALCVGLILGLVALLYKFHKKPKTNTVYDAVSNTELKEKEIKQESDESDVESIYDYSQAGQQDSDDNDSADTQDNEHENVNQENHDKELNVCLATDQLKLQGQYQLQFNEHHSNPDHTREDDDKKILLQTTCSLDKYDRNFPAERNNNPTSKRQTRSKTTKPPNWKERQKLKAERVRHREMLKASPKTAD